MLLKTKKNVLQTLIYRTSKQYAILRLKCLSSWALQLFKQKNLIVSVIRIKSWCLFHPMVGFIVFVIWEHLEKLLVQRNQMNMLSKQRNGRLHFQNRVSFILTVVWLHNPSKRTRPRLFSRDGVEFKLVD